MMNIFKRLFVTFLVVFTLITHVSCDVIKNFLPSIGSDLQLLRIETPSNSDNVSLRKAKSIKKEAKKEIDSEDITLTAVIKNESRASFIDMVVYDSISKKTVVYNEGNGLYQCSSETVYEDEMWVTNVQFSMNISSDVYEDFFIEIKEIKFLKNSVDTLVDLNEVDVRRVDFTFSDSYLSRSIKQDSKNNAIAEVKIEQIDSKSMTCMISALLKIEIENNQSVTINEIEIPDEISLKYYENKELKEDIFKIEWLKVSGLVDSKGNKYDSGERKIKKINISDKVHGVLDEYTVFAEIIEYKEGSKEIVAYPTLELIIPSSAEELKLDMYNNHYEYYKISYKGTREDFYKIKGAKEYIETKPIKVECIDGTIIPGNGSEDSDTNKEDEEKVDPNLFIITIDVKTLEGLSVENGYKNIFVENGNGESVILGVNETNIEYKSDVMVFEKEDDSDLILLKLESSLHQIVKLEVITDTRYDDLDFYKHDGVIVKLDETFDSKNCNYIVDVKDKYTYIGIENNSGYRCGIKKIIVTIL